MPLGERVVFFVESELSNTSPYCMKDLEIAVKKRSKKVVSNSVLLNSLMSCAVRKT